MTSTSTTLSAPSASAAAFAEATAAHTFAARAEAKAAMAREETALFASFTDGEKAAFVAECLGRYRSFLTEGFNWAATCALTPADFGGPLFHRQQVDFLAARAREMAPLEELFDGKA